MGAKKSDLEDSKTLAEWNVTLKDFLSQGPAVAGLIENLSNNTFVHAYLISGPAGIGKRTLRDLMTQTLLCSSEQQRPCGQCPSCVQCKSNTHPDVITLRVGQPVSPDVKKGMTVIPISDIRYAIAKAGEHTFTGGRRVIRIEDAERMNESAANALLKTLQEPPEDTIFILTTQKPQMLLSTIISRCRPVKMHPWNDAYVREILEKNGAPEHRIDDAVRTAAGSIGKAWTISNDESYWERRNNVMQRFFCMTQRSDVVKVSGQMRDEAKSMRSSAEETLDDLSELLRTLMMVRLGRYEKEAVSSFPQPWRRAANEAPLHVFTDLLDAVSEARKMLESNVTWQATTERLMLNMMEEMNKWST